MPTYTTLKGFDEIGDVLLLEQLESNLIEFFNWGLLGKGAFFNHTIPSPAPYGNDFTKLRRVKDRNYVDGQVWEGGRHNWIWESGIEYSTQPIQISGVNVDNDFIPAGSGFHIDYPGGRVVFDEAIPTNSEVTLEYSNRWINLYPSNMPWFRELIFESFRIDHSSYFTTESGLWDVLSHNRIQLPAVIVESIPTSTMSPRQLGDTSQNVQQGVLFHIFAEDSWTRNKLVDVIRYQTDKTIRLFDYNKVYDNDDFPLNRFGDKQDNPLTYPDLVDQYLWRSARFERFRPMKTDSKVGLFRATVQGDVYIEMHDL